MWSELLTAAGLVLVIEGLLPFLSPRRFRRVLLSYAAIEDRWVRTIGLASMLLGLLILNTVK
ncbi:MAG: DUF2065 domain-containing protein [Panacagrimonas sp.]